MSKEIEDILVKLCMQQPSNAVFEEPLTEAMLSIKNSVNRVIDDYHMGSLGDDIKDDIAKLFEVKNESEGR